MFTIGVFGIITDDSDRVLLCHRRDYDLWNLPGGGEEAGESPWSALVREIREEICLEAMPVHLTGVYSKTDRDELVLSFACQIIGGEMNFTDEADKIEYFEVGQIPQNTAPKQIERIEDYLADKTKTYYKLQTGPSSIDLIRSGKM